MLPITHCNPARPWVAGVDACRGGWIAFKIDLKSRTTSVELIDLPSLLRNMPEDLAALAVDIPIGLNDGPRKCDQAARKLLGRPRASSVFSAPCRASLFSPDHTSASATNRQMTGKGLSLQAWGIASKIKQVDDAISPECQDRVFEVHPEVCFWALAGKRPMIYSKKTENGAQERLAFLRSVFPGMEGHLQNRPPRVKRDDLLDAAVAAWSALNIWSAAARRVSEPELDERGLKTTIWY
jgi:predicted RNase H-like nuclease